MDSYWEAQSLICRFEHWRRDGIISTFNDDVLDVLLSIRRD